MDALSPPAATDVGDLAERGRNQRTVQSYEEYAPDYAEAVSRVPTGGGKEAIDRLVKGVGPRGTVLEIGSGPGWDADYLEERGIVVSRTDVTSAFRELQRARGRTVGKLDILSDEISGCYDGVLMLYVLQHIDRDWTGAVLRKIATALRPGGTFVVSLREGEGEGWETGDATGKYYTVLRTEAELRQQLAAVDLDVVWLQQDTDKDGSWLIVVAQKGAASPLSSLDPHG
jgi:SAM-dependent methyltransferase